MGKGFELGHKKLGGKQVGSENKVTKESRLLFKETLAGQVKNIALAFDEVFENDKAKYLDLFAKYAQYFIPKQLDLTTDGEKVNQFDLKATVNTFFDDRNKEAKNSD